MSACFSQVIDRMFHPTLEQQGELSLIKALLEYASANNSGSDVITNNPASEVLRRLMDANVNQNALTIIRHRLDETERKYKAGK